MDEDIRTHIVRGFEVSYFLVETKKAKEANIFICLGCESVYGNSCAIDPNGSLLGVINLHHRGAGEIDAKCKKSLYLKIDRDLIEAEKNAAKTVDEQSTQEDLK